MTKLSLNVVDMERSSKYKNMISIEEMQEMFSPDNYDYIAVDEKIEEINSKLIKTLQLPLDRIQNELRKLYQAIKSVDFLPEDAHDASSRQIGQLEGILYAYATLFWAEVERRQKLLKDSSKDTAATTKVTAWHPWCANQILDENNKVSCIAHLAEGRVLDCPYTNAESRLEAQYPCSDYEPEDNK